MEQMQPEGNPRRDQDATEREIRKLIRDLGNLRSESREAAIRRLSAIGSPAIAPLQKAIRSHERWKWLVSVVLYSYVFTAGFELTNTYLDGGWHAVGFLRVFWFLLIASGINTFSRSAFGSQEYAAAALAGIADAKAIGPLIEALGAAGPTDASMRYSVVRALYLSMAKLEPGDRIALTDHQVECLHGALNIHDAFSAVAVLKVIEVLGDQRSIAAVERFLTRFPRQANPTPSLSRDLFTHADALRDGTLMPAEAQVRVRVAAEACLAALRERAAQAAATSTLLRAADSEHEAQTELLRPTESRSPEETEHLLRPSTSGAEETP
jgi:hypothetical protein